MARPNILLVDDNRLFLEMEKGFLQSCAVQIYTARTGKEALDIMRMILPDLVFLDLHMPDMDGDVCCAAIKADPDLRHVPVVMVVNAADGDDLERCRLACCDSIVTRPVDRAAFLTEGHRFLPGLDHIEVRVPCVTLVAFRIGEMPFYGTSVNVSTNGIFIAFDGEVEVDDLVRLSFLLPGVCDGIIEAVGRIAWRNAGSSLCNRSLPRGFGVEFREIGPDAVECIVRYMAGAESCGLEGAYIAEQFF